MYFYTRTVSALELRPHPIYICIAKESFNWFSGARNCTLDLINKLIFFSVRKYFMLMCVKVADLVGSPFEMYVLRIIVLRYYNL